MAQQKNKGLLRNDILLGIAFLSVAALLLACLFLLKPTGDTVQVTVNGSLYGEYPLSQNMTLDIVTGETKEQHNQLVIEDGKAFVETATCRDGICVSHSPVFRDGESIVCLPHKVVITVVAKESSSDGVDGVA